MIYWKQLKSLLRHKWYILRVGRQLGGIPLWRLIVHDWSKFSKVEFVNYARYKYGLKSVDGWSKAWLHHLHHNPHHPEHWILSWRGDPDFYNGFGQGVVPFITVLAMPEMYVREMAADMMATSKEITGSYDIGMWLIDNMPEMRLHFDTRTRLNYVLHEVNYGKLINEITIRR